MAVTLSDRVTIRIGPGSTEQNTTDKKDTADKIVGALGGDKSKALDDIIKAYGGDPTGMTDDEKVQWCLDHDVPLDDILVDEDGNVSLPKSAVEDIAQHMKDAGMFPEEREGLAGYSISNARFTNSFTDNGPGRKIRFETNVAVYFATNRPYDGGGAVIMFSKEPFTCYKYDPYTRETPNSSFDGNKVSGVKIGDTLLDFYMNYSTTFYGNPEDGAGYSMWYTPSHPEGVYSIPYGSSRAEGLQCIAGFLYGEIEGGLDLDNLDSTLTENGAETRQELVNKPVTYYDESYNYLGTNYYMTTDGTWITRSDTGNGYVAATAEYAEALNSLYGGGNMTGPTASGSLYYLEDRVVFPNT